MTISAAHAAAGFVACWSRFVDALPDAWERHGVGAYAYVTGIPLPTFNGAMYGAAMTARCAQDGYDAGSAYSLLQSSVMGYPVYQRMGFRTVDTWPMLVTSS